MERITHKLILEMSNASIIENDSDTLECYQYGLELVLTSLFIFVVMLFSSFFTGSTLECILFAVFFCPLRSMTGGYHCHSFLSCLIFSISIWGIYVLLSRTSFFYNIYPILFLLLASIFYIWIKAPIEHPNNPLQSEEKALLKKRIRTLLIIYVVVSLVFAIFDVSIKSVLYYSIYIITMLMLINRFGGETNNEKSLSESDCKN